MYKILIVDDEPLIRQGIKNKINWTALGFEIVAEAKNGVEALDIVKSMPLDVIIADMKMPKMDGVALLKALKKNNIAAKIVVISAYSNFYYTHSAIQCGAFDYILKPIDAQELTAVVTRLKNALETEPLNPLSTKEAFSTPSPIVSAKEKFLKNFSASYLLDKTGAIPKILDIDMELHYKKYVCLVIYTADTANRNTLHMVNHAAKNIADSNHFATTVFQNPIYHNHTFIIWGFSKEITPSLLALIENLAYTLNPDVKSSISIGVGTPCSNFNEINMSFTTALNALSYRNIQNSNTTIFYDDIKSTTTKPLSYAPEKENAFLVSLEICNWDEMQFNIEALFNMLNHDKYITFRQVYKLCSELLFLCERLLRKYDSGLENIFEEDITSIDYIASTGSLTQLQEWFSEVMHKIMQQIKIKKSKEIGSIIEDIMNHINAQYFEDISLHALSEKYHINKSYLSTIFKDYSGHNFIDYLTKIRMEKAGELLKDKKFKVYEVSKMVGYQDQRYFSKLFKKHYGVLPNKYQKS